MPLPSVSTTRKNLLQRLTARFSGSTLSSKLFSLDARPLMLPMRDGLAWRRRIALIFRFSTWPSPLSFPPSAKTCPAHLETESEMSSGPCSRQQHLCFKSRLTLTLGTHSICSSASKPLILASTDEIWLRQSRKGRRFFSHSEQAVHALH